MNNPMQFLQMFTQMRNGGMNPQQLLGMLGNNPMLGQAQKMVAGKSVPQMQELVRNLAKQKGMSDNELSQVASQFGIKL